MFKNFIDKTKEAAKNISQVDSQPEEPDYIANAKASVKNMKWSLKLLIQLAKTHYVNANKQVESGGTFSATLASFSDKTSHTSYITNQTEPLSVALKETAEGVKNTQIYFQQYTQLFADKFANQLQSLYTTHVKRLAQLVKQQEEVRFKFNLANSNLKSAQKSGTSGSKLAERQTDYDNNKSHYDKVNENLDRSVKEMVAYVQKEIAIAMKAFVADQQLLVQEGIKIWAQSENKIFGVESPLTQPQQQQPQQQYQPQYQPQYQQPQYQEQQPYQPQPVSLEKLSIDDSNSNSPHQQVPQHHQHESTSTNSSNPFDDKNPFDN